MAQRSYPLDDTLYKIADSQLYTATRTSGVYSADDNLAVSANNSMSVSVSKGLAWLKYGEFNGAVYANTADVQLNIDIADGVLPRIDTIVVRYDSIINTIELAYVRGTSNSSPSPTPPQRDVNRYEIVLAEIYVAAGTTAITAANITDKRLDETVCGVMRDGVTGIPTAQLYAQFNSWSEEQKTEFSEWVETIKGILGEDEAGNLLNLINSHTSNTDIHTNAEEKDNWIVSGREEGTVVGEKSVALGRNTTASGDYSTAMGSSTTASGSSSTTMGSSTTASGLYSTAMGIDTTASGDYGSTAMGNTTKAIGKYSTAMGRNTTASGSSSTAMGSSTKAIGENSTAMGSSTTASGDYDSTAMGYNTTASGNTSTAMGYNTTASGNTSTAMGYNTTASETASTAMGRYNKTMSSGDLFVIGNGSSSSNSNAFRVTDTGEVYGTGSYHSSGADYSEYFEWLDGNPNSEDRVGHFVTLDGEKIKYANENDYIVGIVSATPAIVGDSASENWKKQYKTDIYGRIQYEEKTFPEEHDGEVVIREARTEIVPILSPDYDPEKDYLNREQRKEWAIIGMFGKLIVVDDGSCRVNGYCKPSKGIATAASTGYRVMSRLDRTHIKVLIK